MDRVSGGVALAPTVPPAQPAPAQAPVATPAPQTPIATPAPQAPVATAAPSALTPSFPSTFGSATATSNSSVDPISAAAASRLAWLFAGSSQPPPFLIPIYQEAGRRYDVPWTVLAAINSIETDYGRNLSVSSAGAIGWMQFMPATWSQYGVSADGHGKPNPSDPADAIFSAANYLQANGASHDLRAAILAYNHADWYVDEVMWKAMQINVDVAVPRRASSASAQSPSGSAQATTVDPQSPTATAQTKVTAMLTTASLLNGLPYIYGGGHSSWTVGPGYDCSGFVSAVLHAAGYLSAPADTQTLPSQPGILKGPGKWVTIFDRTEGGALDEDHVIINIDGQWWESGGTTSAGVHQMPSISPSYLATFNLILHPAGL